MKWALLAVTVLTGCNDDTPPHWQDVCVSQTFSHFLPITIMVGKVPTVQLIPIYVCAKTERQCVVGDDFQGDRDCSALPEGGDNASS